VQQRSRPHVLTQAQALIQAWCSAGMRLLAMMARNICWCKWWWLCYNNEIDSILETAGAKLRSKIFTHSSLLEKQILID